MLLSPEETRDVDDVELGLVTVREYIRARLLAHLWTRGDAHLIRIPERLCRGTSDAAWTELVRECRDDGWRVFAMVSGVSGDNLGVVTLSFTKR